MNARQSGKRYRMIRKIARHPTDEPVRIVGLGAPDLAAAVVRHVNEDGLFGHVTAGRSPRPSEASQLPGQGPRVNVTVERTPTGRPWSSLPWWRLDCWRCGWCWHVRDFGDQASRDKADQLAAEHECEPEQLQWPVIADSALDPLPTPPIRVPGLTGPPSPV